MTKYKLVYFDIFGRGELSRYLFALAKVEYEDSRVSEDQWKELKKTVPQGQLPVMYIDDECFPQSLAIARNLAREFGFYGSNNLEATRIDVVVQTVNDVFDELAQALFYEKDEERKAEKTKKFREESMPKYLKSLGDILAKNNNGQKYFVGDKVSLADVCVFNLLNDFLAKLGFSEGATSTPSLVAHTDRMKEIPELKAWLEKRPESSF